MLERPISKAGWTRVRFDQIATQINDRVDNPAEAGVERYVGLEHLDPDSLRIRRWGEPSDVESTKLRFQPGDIIFGKRRVYQRKVAVADFEGICSAHAMVLRAKTGAVLPEFLPFFMQSDLFMERALSISVGSLSPTINWKALAAEEFLLPPIQEQARLVEVLSAFGHKVDSLFNSLRYCDLAVRAVLDAQFPVCEIRSLLAEKKVADPTCWTKLGEIASLQSGFAFPSDGFTSSGDRLMRCSNVGVDCTSWEPEETRYWPSEQRSEVEDFLLNEKDIVIAMDRPFVSEGFKVAMIQTEDLPALLLQRVGRFKLRSDAFHPILWAFVHSPSFQYQLEVQQEGTDLPHISKAQIEGTLLPRQAIFGGPELEGFLALYEKKSDIHKRLLQTASLKNVLLRSIT